MRGKREKEREREREREEIIESIFPRKEKGGVGSARDMHSLLLFFFL